MDPSIGSGSDPHLYSTTRHAVATAARWQAGTRLQGRLSVALWALRFGLSRVPPVLIYYDLRLRVRMA
jgi:hypothetical protein